MFKRLNKISNFLKHNILVARRLDPATRNKICQMEDEIYSIKKHMYMSINDNFYFRREYREEKFPLIITIFDGYTYDNIDIKITDLPETNIYYDIKYKLYDGNIFIKLKLSDGSRYYKLESYDAYNTDSEITPTLEQVYDTIPKSFTEMTVNKYQIDDINRITIQ